MSEFSILKDCNNKQAVHVLNSCQIVYFLESKLNKETAITFGQLMDFVNFFLHVCHVTDMMCQAFYINKYFLMDYKAIKDHVLHNVMLMK